MMKAKRLTWGVILILGILVVVRLISSIPEAPETSPATSPPSPSNSSPTHSESSTPQSPTSAKEPKDLTTAPTVPAEQEPPQPNSSPNEAHALTEARVERVVDGDTIVVSLPDGSKTRVRYIGIDTPETVHPSKPVECFGKEASNFNKQLVEGKTVWLEFDVERYDRYNRLLAYVWLTSKPFAPEQNMVNAILVKEGYAQAYTYPPNVKYSELFVQLQREAREQGRGLWTACQTDGSAATQESKGSEEDSASSSATEVYIASVLPNPFGGKVPEDEPWKEWVKICNAGSEPVDLSGWSLGDKQSFWTISSGFTIPAQGCITITGKD